MSACARGALLLAGMLPLAACVPLAPEDDPLQVRVDDVDRRLGRVERTSNPQVLAELAQRLDTLQQELRTLRGQIEVLQNGQDSGSETLRKQQRDLYADLDRRLAALEARAGLPSAAGAPGPSGAGPAAPERAAPASVAAERAGSAARPDEPSRLYGRAFDALRAANYPAAIAGMREFVLSYPEHELAPNAQYWLGEAHYVTRDYAGAAEAFESVVRKWPDNTKAPDALLKLGLAQAELKRHAQARESLSEVGRRFPGSEAARLADERLRRLP